MASCAISSRRSTIAWALAPSMSLTALARTSASSDCNRASWSRLIASAAWRASSMMRPASVLASASWALYSASTVWASDFAPSAAWRSDRMRSVRACMPCLICG